MIYDPDSGRWFACACDLVEESNRVFLAVSNTSDPTQGWKAIAIPTDPSGQTWADFPRMGIDQNAIYLSMNMFPLSGSGTSNDPGEQVVIPKQDLLQANPTAANATIFSNIADAPLTDTPAIAFGSSTPEPFVSSGGTASGTLQITSIDGPATSLLLIRPTASSASPPHPHRLLLPSREPA